MRGGGRLLASNPELQPSIGCSQLRSLLCSVSDAVNVYFCCLEALQNACKHAGAGATVIMTLTDRDGLSFDVQDTGVGCQPATILTGHGFANMRDRLDAIGGTLIVHTRPGAGVHLQG
jgi:signal transduction histidine kinase